MWSDSPPERRFRRPGNLPSMDSQRRRWLCCVPSSIGLKRWIMARHKKYIDDTDLKMELPINSYAVFMGYLSMAIKGLGFLILTWSTVVLLGGFVSALHNKDFWCLTFITLVTLVQTAGIFDVYLNEKLSNILYSASGFIAGSGSAFFSDEVVEKAGIVAIIVRGLLAALSVVVQMMVLAILLCPLAAVYVFGLLISTGISLWRLIQHDYGGNSDEQANLKPAMDTLYCLALLQGVVFLYRIIFDRAGKRIAKNLLPLRGGNDELDAVLSYLRETIIGCEKNPSFARGRNFITHAVDLIGSKSPADCLSGVQLLYTTICFEERTLKAVRFGEQKKLRLGRWKEIIVEHMLMKNLIMSAFSSPVLQKLLQTLNPRGALYNREMRNQAARIVAHLALDIHLEQFPRGIQNISTLIGTYEEYRLIEPYHRDQLIHRYDQDWDRQASRLPSPASNNEGVELNEEDKLQKSYEKLVLRGLCILRKLAADKNNCRIMSEAQGLLPKIMAPLTSDLIHHFNGGAWSINVVEGSLKVMRFLVAAPGETGARMRQEISNNKEAIRTMERILSCACCHVKLRKRAMGILIQLYMDTKSRPAFIEMLVGIFAFGDNFDMSIRNLAGEALAKLCFQSGSNTGIILQLDGDVVGSLTKILLDVKNKTCRIRAAEILEHMCNIQHIQDDECISKFKKAMTTTMPEVLAEILGYELTKDETHARPEPAKLEIVVKENQYKEDKTFPCTHPDYSEYEEEMDVEEDESENEEDEEFSAPLLSLCVTVFDTFISADQGLAYQFDAISLPKKLKEFVQKNNVPTVCCLRLMKLTCKMVISMMKHSGSYDKDDLDCLMNALFNAPVSMAHLDMSMVFTSQDDGATAMKPVRSLLSLLREAKESVETRTATKAHESENIMEPSTSGPPPMGDTN